MNKADIDGVKTKLIMHYSQRTGKPVEVPIALSPPTHWRALNKSALFILVGRNSRNLTSDHLLNDYHKQSNPYSTKGVIVSLEGLTPALRTQSLSSVMPDAWKDEAIHCWDQSCFWNLTRLNGKPQWPGPKKYFGDII